MKILHVADIHGRDKDIEEIEKCLNFAVETIFEQAVDLAVIAGDCFDSRDIKLDSRAAKLIIRTVSRLADIAPVVIIKGTESHDGNAPEILQYARGKYPVCVASSPMQIKMVKKHSHFYRMDMPSNGEPDAIITLIPQATKQFFNQGDIQQSNENISQALNGLFMGFGAQAEQYPCPHVLVYHGSISGAKLSNQQVMTGMDIEVSVDQLNLANPDIVMCGHIHFPQELPRNVFYSGSIYPNNFGENHKHGFYIHEIEEAA
ncbi:MAG: metallophosphoesterase [Smithella sp.]|jgi:DNA repair exonuclease SbcCD nuclease subunit